eukprot:m51a1_g8517 putative n -dimethylguanosine trna methyltransferase (549) ;mRNA; f:99773-101867
MAEAQAAAAAAAAAPAAAAEAAEAVPEGYRVVREGQAAILHSGEAFYNPVQEFNRDLSIASLRVLTRRRQAAGAAGGPRVLEALAATGLRSVRYAKEVPGLGCVVANDIDQGAVDQIRRNASYNGIAPDLLVPNQGDASAYMYAHKEPRERFDVIDLDPYGSAIPFLDSAVQAVADGGYLFVTFTDMAVLAGAKTDVCYTKYGSMPVRGPHCHEFALRIAVACIQAHANRHRRHVVPLACVSVDFYIRVFLQVFSDAAGVNRVPASLAYVCQCTGCDSFALQPLARATQAAGGRATKITPALLGAPAACEHCGRGVHLGGPVWAAPLHDAQWLAEVRAVVDERPEAFGSRKRLVGFLTLLAEELPDAPLFYRVDSLSHTLRASTPPRYALEHAIRAAGYRVSASHTEPQALKTDAPARLVWDIMRCWAREHPPKGVPEASPAHALLAVQPLTVVAFGDIPKPHKDKGAAVPRFIPTPENWGPGTRAGRKNKRPQPPKEEQREQKEHAADEAGEAQQQEAKKQRTAHEGEGEGDAAMAPGSAAEEGSAQ